MLRKQLLATLFVLVAALAVAAQQQQPAPPANFTEAMDRQLTNAERTVVGAADAMPADKYDFAPPTSMGDFKGVRTFAQQARHIATANYAFAAALLGEKPPVDLSSKDPNGPEIKGKDAILKNLKDSYAYAHKAIAKLNDQNKLELIDGPFGSKMTRFGMSNLLIWHPYDHYGQMVVYLRMNGIIPPASRQQ